MAEYRVLKNQKEFDEVYRKGKSVPDRYLVLLYRKNGRPEARISFLASKKVGNSVKRNRARRLMKESLRLSGIRLQPGTDYVVIARQSINGVKQQDVQKSLVSAFRRSLKGKKK